MQESMFDDNTETGLESTYSSNLKALEAAHLPGLSSLLDRLEQTTNPQQVARYLDYTTMSTETSPRVDTKR